MPRITRELIEAGESGHGGWNQEQFRLIGVEWPPREGWKDRVIGKEISEADAQRFVEFRGMTKSKRRYAPCHGQLGLGFDP